MQPKLQEIINNPDVYSFGKNEIWSKYLVPHKVLPDRGCKTFGSYILHFNSEELLNAWKEIHEQVIKKLKSIEGIEEYLTIVTIEDFDEISILQERPFNEGYTTDSYDEYLNYGSCKPNEWIIEGLYNLRIKLLELDTFDENEISENDLKERDSVIGNVIHKSILKPNSNLVWSEPWCLYLPAIETVHLQVWNK